MAFTELVFFLKYGREKTQSKILEEKEAKSAMLISDIDLRAKQAVERATKAEESSELARKKALENMEKAKSAGIMLEKMRKDSEMSKKEIIDSLNAQLEREADARLAAENASLELAKQRDILKSSMEETQKAYEELKKVSSVTSTSELDKIRKLLEEKDKEIEKLKRNQEELERLRRLAEDMQKNTEKAIIEQGGTPILPRSKLILSPNIRTNR